MLYYLFPIVYILLCAVLSVVFRKKFSRLNKKSILLYIGLAVLLTGASCASYAMSFGEKVSAVVDEYMTFALNIAVPVFSAIYLCHLFLGSKFEENRFIRFISNPVEKGTVTAALRSFYADDRRYLSRVGITIIPAILFPFMYCIFGPTELYFANISEWDFIYTDFIFGAVAVSLIFIAVFGFILPAILRGKIFNVYAVIFIGITLMSYLQNLLFNGTLGTLDGKYTDWIWHSGFTVFNTLLWVAVLTAMLVLYSKNSKRLFKVCKILSIVVLAAQVGSLPYYFINADDSAFTYKTGESEWDLSGDSQFTVSSDENIIVIILDSFGKNEFRDYCAPNEEYARMFKDFVSFDNVNTEHRMTALSLPYILTATPLDTSCSIISSNRNAWNSPTAEYFYSSLRNNGYTVNLYTDSEMYTGGAEYMRGKISNVDEYKINGYTIDSVGLTSKIIKLSSYRLAPNCMKNLFWMYPSLELNSCATKDSQKITTDTDDWKQTAQTTKLKGTCYYNYDFYEELENSGLKTDDGSKYCVIQYLWGTHPPYVSLDKNDTDVTEWEALDGCMILLSDYFDRLKELGVYDSSTIIVTADHGNARAIGDIAPALLIKRAGETRDSFETNSSPVNLQTDLLPTILDCAGIDYSQIGTSAYSIPADENRMRYQYTLAYDEKYPSVAKAASVGESEYNVLYKYSYNGTEDMIDTENYEIIPIYDFWW